MTTVDTPASGLTEEERLSDDEVAEPHAYRRLLGRLSHQSVVKHFDAYADIAWESDEFRIDPTDPRWELGGDDPLGATAWYRAQPDEVRSRIGLHLIASKMKVGTQFENVLQRGLLEFAWTLPNGAPEFRYVYHEVIEEGQHSLMFQEFVNRTGFDVPGLGFWDRLGARRVIATARRCTWSMGSSPPSTKTKNSSGNRRPILTMRRVLGRRSLGMPGISKPVRFTNSWNISACCASSMTSW